jgi:hypothetical protein
MHNGPDPAKAERFAEFLRRLGAAPAASSFTEAFRQLGDILNAVEDELASIPYDPANWQNDGRMYPPQLDSARIVPGRSDVTQFRSRAHNTLIGDNGAIEIRDLSGRPFLTKAGTDGRMISEQGARS